MRQLPGMADLSKPEATRHRLHPAVAGGMDILSRACRALLAGAVAIALNTAALAAADLVPLATAHGGLLRFLVLLSGGALPVPAGSAFQAGFHVLVGLAMALLYGLALEPVLRGPSWLRGLIYAAAVWLANAVIVLPATGEGFAGSRHLTLAGMVWFAAAHTLFFVVLAILYARLQPIRRTNRP